MFVTRFETLEYQQGGTPGPRLKSGAVRSWEEIIIGAPRFWPYRLRFPPKKYSPPYPLDTKGCCSPQNNPKKSSSVYWPKSEVISNILFVHCTARFTCILHEMHVLRQCVVTYWLSALSSSLQPGDLSTFHRLNCFPSCCRLPIAINFQRQFACKLSLLAIATPTWIRSFRRSLTGN
jgi:hypothetical protein